MPGRQTGKMTSRTPGPDAGPHAAHDRLLVAGRVAGDLTGAELQRADTLLASCDACRALLADLTDIAAATRHLSPPVRPAELDFRLTPERATALERHRTWRRLLRPFGRNGSAVRPLATAFTTLGLAGLLLATLPTLPLGGGAARFGGPVASVGTRDLSAASVEPLPARTGTEIDAAGRTAVPPVPTTDPKAVDQSGGVDNQGHQGGIAETAGPGAGSAGSSGDGAAVLVPESSGGSGGPDAPIALIILSVGFLGVGIGLLLLRRAALRLR